MKCPYCGMHFSDNWIVQEVARVHRTGWFYRTALCPECTQMTIELCSPLRSDIMNQLDQLSVGEQHTTIQRLGQWRQVHPIGSNRGPVPPEVPKPIAADYVGSLSGPTHQRKGVSRTVTPLPANDAPRSRLQRQGPRQGNSAAIGCECPSQTYPRNSRCNP